MASPITTRGFSVQERPGINYLDPRLFAGGLSEIVPNIGRGATTVGGLVEMQENAQIRPVRSALANVQIQEAQNRLAMAPLEQQLAALRLGEAQQQAAIPSDIVEAVDITGGGKRLTLGDTSVPFEDIQITEEFTPRVRETRGTRVKAGGVTEPFTKREVLATVSDISRQAEKDALEARAEQRLSANQESLALYRQAQAEAAQLRAENDRIKAQAAMQRAQLMEANPTIGFVDVKRADGKTYRQYFQKSDPSRIIHEIDRGDIGGDTFFNFFGRSQAGGAPPVVGDGAAQAASDLASMFGGPSGTRQTSLPTPKTKAERDALPTGTSYIGPDGRKYIKR